MEHITMCYKMDAVHTGGSEHAYIALKGPYCMFVIITQIICHATPVLLCDA